MILIDSVLLDEEISEQLFICDIKKCKGACCTFYGDFGAPIMNEEVEIMNKCLPFASKYLTKKTRKYIDENGIVEGNDGNYTTVCINKKDCVFVFYEKKVAYCAFEKAFIDGKINFRKPLSCHLFPIRVADWSTKHLYYQEISECQPAIIKGKKEKIFMFESLKEPLIRKFGETWYKNFVNYIKLNGK